MFPLPYLVDVRIPLLIYLFLVDITTYFRGFHGDVNETVFVGTPDEKAIRLVKNTYNCLAKSMDAGMWFCMSKALVARLFIGLSVCLIH